MGEASGPLSASALPLAVPVSVDLAAASEAVWNESRMLVVVGLISSSRTRCGVVSADPASSVSSVLGDVRAFDALNCGAWVEIWIFVGLHDGDAFRIASADPWAASSLLGHSRSNLGSAILHH